MIYSDKNYIDFIHSVLSGKEPHNFETDKSLMGEPGKPPGSATKLKNGWMTYIYENDKLRIVYDDNGAWGSNSFYIIDGKLEKEEYDQYDFIEIFKLVFNEEFIEWYEINVVDKLSNSLLKTEEAIIKKVNKI
jgi:hypothetical protein